MSYNQEYNEQPIYIRLTASKREVEYWQKYFMCLTFVVSVRSYFYGIPVSLLHGIFPKEAVEVYFMFTSLYRQTDRDLVQRRQAGPARRRIGSAQNTPS